MHQSVIDAVLTSEDAGPPRLDAAMPAIEDAGTDAAMPPNETARCTCSVASRGPRALSFLVAIALIVSVRRRRRRPTHP
jgi:MYXO-CTERM domain-containing protein